MIQYCSYGTARRLMDMGLFLTLSAMAYQVEQGEIEHVAAQVEPTDRCREWLDQQPQSRFIVFAPTLCELLQLVPIQTTCDRLGYWHMARYRDAVGKSVRVKHAIPVEAVGELIVKLLLDRRVIVDPAEPHGPLIFFP